MPSLHWQTSRYLIDLTHPQIMGIVNLTPDSFSRTAGGANAASHGVTAAVPTAKAGLQHCERLLRDGAKILDLGAESSRPGAVPVSLDDELARLLPVLRGAVTMGVPISVDTYKPAVMRAALDAGADIINDIWALRQPGALQAVASHPRCGVCLMHMHGEPATMQAEPMQSEGDDGADVVSQVLTFLKRRTDTALAEGVQKDRIVWDVGIGFGKTGAQNFRLLAMQRQFTHDTAMHDTALRNTSMHDTYPLLTGWSRKSALGAVTGLPVDQRMVPSVAAAVIAAERGASIIRVHDVAETVAALQVWNAAGAMQ
jgi:dihydropteroate synthase